MEVDLTIPKIEGYSNFQMGAAMGKVQNRPENEETD